MKMMRKWIALVLFGFIAFIFLFYGSNTGSRYGASSVVVFDQRDNVKKIANYQQDSVAQTRLQQVVTELITRKISTGDLQMECFNNTACKTDYKMSDILDKVQFSSPVSYENEDIIEGQELRVIIVPQSHNDPGWLMPLDEYYEKKTVKILDNLVKFMTMYKQMTMIWPEIIFLDKWWREASSDSRSKLKKLVEDGRLEIVSGGWVSPDEATSHYHAVLDQLIEGHQWIKKTFGIRPVNTWPLDQFGYSTSLPYIWKKADMSNVGILRVTFNVKAYLAQEGLFNFKWRQLWDKTGEHDVICHVEPYKWFVTDASCGPSPSICAQLLFHTKNERLTIPKLSKVAQMIALQFQQKASLYKQKVIIVPLGGDFAYDTENEWRAQYSNVSALINYINKRKQQFNMNIRFGTVNDYFKEIKSLQRSEKYKTISGDFFTYSEDQTYWSGYFTTRPFDKQIGRVLMSYLRSTEILTGFAMSLGHSTNEVKSYLTKLEHARRTLALFQHHDAITGTSTHATAQDYRQRLHVALSFSIDIMSNCIREILRASNNIDGIEVIALTEQISHLNQVNRKILNLSSDEYTLLFWNGYERKREEIRCLLVKTFSGFSVQDISYNNVEFQVNPVWLNDSDISQDIVEVCFSINVPAFGFSVFKLIKNDVLKLNMYKAKIWTSERRHYSVLWDTLNIGNAIFFKNSYLSVHFDSLGYLKKVCKLGQQMSHAPSCTNLTVTWSKFDDMADAYVLVPYGSPLPLQSSRRNVRIISGNLLSKIVITSDVYQQTFTLYNINSLQGHVLHLENNVTILHQRYDGIELLMNVETDIKTNKEYYTDANGLQMVRRHWIPGLPLGANFYPITTMTFLEDQSKRVTVHSAQPLGVSSLMDGHLSILIDRRPVMSGKGLTESVLDNRPAISRFFLQIEDNNRSLFTQNSSQYSMFPSIHSALINDYLQNPILDFNLNGKVHRHMKFKNFLLDDLDCDISIANFRNFIDDGVWNGCGLTLHRRPIPCHTETPHKECGNRKNIKLYELFSSPPQHIFKSSLTHFNSHERTKQSDDVVLKPMDLESYIIKWK